MRDARSTPITLLRQFGYLLKSASHRYAQRFEQHAREISLTLPPSAILAFLEQNQGIRQSRLAERVGLEPMSLVRILDRLEADGLVERRTDPLDRRGRQLYFTPKTKSVLDLIWRFADLSRAEAFSGVSPAERDVFFKVLQKLDANLRAIVTLPSSDGLDGMNAPNGREQLGRGLKPTDLEGISGQDGHG